MKYLTHLYFLLKTPLSREQTFHARPPILGNGSRVPVPDRECVGTQVNLAHTLQTSPHSVSCTEGLVWTRELRQFRFWRIMPQDDFGGRSLKPVGSRHFETTGISLPGRGQPCWLTLLPLHTCLLPLPPSPRPSCHSSGAHAAPPRLGVKSE